MQGGSTITSTVGSAVYDVCTAVKNTLADMATKSGSPLAGSKADDLTLADGMLYVEADRNKKVAVADLMRSNNLTTIDKTQQSKGGGEQENTHSRCISCRSAFTP
ncbi:hypothetical protein [Spirosoma pomorum]|jgi:xanthine dehydrogenase YagR molybdenum-binding subunit